MDEKSVKNLTLPVKELTDDEVQFQIDDADVRGDASRISQQALVEYQKRARAEGRCGSLQTPTGLPCKRFATRGTTVCAKHGSRAPQTLAKAERMLAIARMPFIEALLDYIDQYNSHPCTGCGYPIHDTEARRTMIAAAKLVFDRTGLGPRATLDINAKRTDDTDALLEQMTEAERESLLLHVAAIEEVKAAVRVRLKREQAIAQLPGAVIDAEVIDRG